MGVLEMTNPEDPTAKIKDIEELSRKSEACTSPKITEPVSIP